MRAKNKRVRPKAVKKLAVTRKAAAQLLAVKQHILEEPLRLDMDTWGRITPPELEAFCLAPQCGVVACIAGWLVKLANPRTRFYSVNVKEKAKALLGISKERADALFFVSGWPMRFRWSYAAASISNSPQSRLIIAQLAAKRIDYFLKTGK